MSLSAKALRQRTQWGLEGNPHVQKRNIMPRPSRVVATRANEAPTVDSLSAGPLPNAILSNEDDAIIIADLSHHVLLINAVASELFGVPQSNATGMALCDLLNARVAAPEGADALPLQPVATPLRDSDGGAIGEAIIIRSTHPRPLDRDALEQANAALSARVTEFETLFHLLPIGIYVAEDPECKMIRGNRFASETMQSRPGSNVSRSMPDVVAASPVSVQRDGIVVDPDDLPMQKAARLGHEVSDDVIDIVSQDGSKRSLVGFAAPLMNADKTVRGCIGAFADITPLQQMSQVLRESESLYRGMIELSPDGIAVSQNHKFLLCNDGMSRQLAAASSDDLIGRELLDFVQPEDREATYERIQRIYQGEKFPPRREKRVRVDGSVYDVSVVRALVAYKGEPAILVVTRDVTDIIRTEIALKESEEFYRALIDLTPDAISVMQNQRIALCNRAMLAQLGAESEQDVIGRNVMELLDPAFHASAAERIRKELSGTATPPMHERVVRLDGTTLDVEIALAPVTYKNEPAILAVGRDITERLRLDAALRESEDLYRTLVELCPDAVSVVQEGVIAFANGALVRQLGATSQDEIIGRTFLNFVHPDEHAVCVERAKRVMNGDCMLPRRERIRRLDGSEFEIEIALTPVTYKNAPAILAIGRDLTERNRLDAALRESEARYQGVVASLAEGVCVHGVTGTIVMANEAAERILGLTPDQIMGRSPLDAHWGAIHEDGSVFPGNEHPAMVTLRTGKPLRDVTMGISKPNGTTTWISVNSQPLIDQSTHERRGVVASFFDVTERKRAERETKARAEREAVLNRIGTAIRNCTDPEKIQAIVSIQLGEYLALDRCFYITYDQIENVLHIGSDWRRPDLESLAGTHRVDDISWVLDELFSSGTALVSRASDPTSMYTRSTFEERFIRRTTLAVPFYDEGEVVAVLFAAMTEPRNWTREEVTLIEQSATLTRAAVEMARVHMHEHTIAQQLQRALQPSIPDHAPGLNIAYYYRAALDEAAVGGDFADVFSGDDETTYLVVGDVSGKGLAAASQVATIRNILRYALDNASDLATPITSVNRTVLKRELLDGFATAFIGRFDGKRNTLTYVNCGQEAGLLLRAEIGEVESLASTGTIIGAMDIDDFAEVTIPLAVGDLVALYTDGISEAGRKRSKMLREEGVAKLLKRQRGTDNVSDALTDMVTGIDRFAKGGISDDQCLLLFQVVARP